MDTQLDTMNRTAYNNITNGEFYGNLTNKNVNVED
jgi:hypothetical protein